MTVSQLRAFALVARLGSVHAAAAALCVTQPAISAAIAALRRDLGDPLLVRSGSGITLTAGGRRLAAHAEEIIGLADQARREVAEAGTATAWLRVVATASFAEHAAAAVLSAFARRVPGSRVEFVVEERDRLAASLMLRSADIAMGSRPSVVDGVAMDVVPFLRYRRIVVAAPSHPLARSSGPVSMAALLRHPWLTGQDGIDEHSEEGRWLSSQGQLPELACYMSETDALAAARKGDGVMLALGHVARADVDRGSLVRLAVPGTPVQGLWCASTLGQGRAIPAARILQSFVTTPDATTAMLSQAGSVRVQRHRPTVHVTLWS